MTDATTTTGRPTLYTEQIAATIVGLLSEGKTLREVCRGDGMPSERTVRTWVLDDREGFAEAYSRARELGYHAMADEVIEIADDGRNDWQERNSDEGKSSYQVNGEAIQRSRLRFDARRWLLSKALPKIYGDKVALAGDGETPLTVVIQKFSDDEGTTS